MKMKYAFLVIFLALVLIACKNEGDKKNGKEDLKEIAGTEIQLEKLWETDSLLTTAESVIYDQKRDVLYVSCINGVSPWLNDGDGFIAKVDLDGKILERKWIIGLDGPKGLGIKDDILYVTDIDSLVRIDLEQEKILDKFAIYDSKNLNDICFSPAGELFYSDSKLSKVYQGSGIKPAAVVNDTLYGGLNGVHAEKDRLLSVGFVSGELFSFDYEKFEGKKLAEGMKGGDGIEAYGKGYFVSSWFGAVYYLDESWKKHKLIDTQEQEINAADIEVIESKDLILVPTFFDNRLMAYKINQVTK